MRSKTFAYITGSALVAQLDRATGFEPVRDTRNPSEKTQVRRDCDESVIDLIDEAIECLARGNVEAARSALLKARKKHDNCGGRT